MIYAYLKDYKQHVAGILLFFLLTGCSSLSGSSLITLNFKSEGNINPDINGRPSPLDVRIYQLADTKKFNQANFFDLYHNVKSTLGQDLLEENQIEVKPQQDLKIDIKLNPNVHSLGLLFAYFNLKDSNWQKVINEPYSNINIDLKADEFQLITPNLSSDLKEKQ